MKEFQVSLSRISSTLKKPRVYVAIALLTLSGLIGTAVAVQFNQKQPVQNSTEDTTAVVAEDSQTDTPEVTEAIPAEPAPVAATEAPQSPPANSPAPSKTVTKAPTKTTTAPAPQPVQTQPIGIYTSGQTFCDSSIVWGSLVEASFSHYRGQSANVMYHLELSTSGYMKVLYTGLVAVPADGTFDVRPPSSTATRAPNARQGDVLRIHLLSPFDVYSKPYNVESFTAGCSS